MKCSSLSIGEKTKFTYLSYPFLECPPHPKEQSDAYNGIYQRQKVAGRLLCCIYFKDQYRQNEIVFSTIGMKTQLLSLKI